MMECITNSEMESLFKNNAVVGLILAKVTILPYHIIFLFQLRRYSPLSSMSHSIPGLIVLRVTQPTMPRPFRVPLPLPVVFFLICAYLVMAPVVEEPRIEFFYAFIFVIVGE